MHKILDGRVTTIEEPSSGGPKGGGGGGGEWPLNRGSTLIELFGNRTQ